MPDRHYTWVSTSDIHEALAAISATRVLVIADSCFAGTLTAQKDHFNFRQNGPVLSAPSHYALTSGNLEPVLDSLDGEHSLFAKTLSGVLQSQQKEFTLSAVFQTIKSEIQRWVQQTPTYAAMGHAGVQRGEFVFRPRATEPQSADVPLRPDESS